MKSFLKNLNTGLISFLIRLFSPRASSLLYKRILVLAPHPDDEAFGLGGTILKLLSTGCKINIAYLTDGEGSGVWYDREKIRKQRIMLSGKAAAGLYIDNSDICRLHLPDVNVPRQGQAGFKKTVNDIRTLIDHVKPDAVFTTHPLDYWPFDHVACAEIALEAVRQSNHKPQLWYYWVWAWYNLRSWKLSVNKLKRLQKIYIRDHLQGKKELTDIYLNSLTPDGKPWSGILPKSLLKAFNYSLEIVERVL